MSVVVFTSAVTFSAAYAYLFKRGLFREDLHPRTFQTATALALTIWLWPLASFTLSYLSPEIGLGFMTIFFLVILWPLDALSTETPQPVTSAPAAPVDARPELSRL